MARRDEIHAVFADPQLNGMDRLYQSIGARLNAGETFDAAYAAVMEAGGEPATTWIRFCVQCATRFEEPPMESDFLAVLEDHCRRPEATE